MQLNIPNFGDKEILNDALNSEKHLTSTYNTFANECANPQLRGALMQLLNDEHAIQFDVFTEMHNRGFYPTPMADQQKIDQAKQKFSCQNRG